MFERNVPAPEVPVCVKPVMNTLSRLCSLFTMLMKLYQGMPEKSWPVVPAAAPPTLGIE
jgi:hypothetical protein